MTVILAYCRNDCSIMLADKRLNIGNNQEKGYQDTGQKLIEFGVGWASGSGLYEVANRVIYYLIEDKMNVLESYKRTLEQIKIGNPHLIEGIDNTAILVSSFDPSTNFNLSFLWNGKCTGLKKEKVIMLPPKDYTKVRELEKKYDLNLGKDGRITEIIYQMLLVFKEISDTSNYVSKTCDIGITLLNDGQFSKLQKSGEISDLINQVENNEF
ncbi:MULTISPECIES: hypothetical protein [Cytobacillus]|uniref:hypothetical protein n=1 Tax=Cytobacillus TaxID=2675230 RepID=UPI00203F1590|nr:MULTISPECIES: hypothetical protein [Cytobacillus]MCM3394853.1 hypothetical protein [Cytobacillus oceanisediminis]UQX56068.1 hypothetical protein M5V91_10805 [Cytobacillus pseudoceanisediminis]